MAKYTMRELVDILNYHTKLYDEGQPEITDKEWDDLYFQLLSMEQKENFAYKDSPTRTIDYQVVSKLNKVEHNHKMLSLDKTKNLDEIRNFAQKRQMLVMSKVDGLTCSLRYINGRLTSAETRGNGVIGEDVLHNALTIPTIPYRVETEEELIIDGEIVCLTSDFEKFSEEYKNPRNFAAGSIRLLDSGECAKRKLTFIAWDVIKGFDEVNLVSQRLLMLETLGFKVVPMLITTTIDDYTVESVLNLSKELSIPIDGLVFKFNDISYGRSLGATAHHFKNAIAYKLYDEQFETHLRKIDWTMGRTGALTPVAVFDPVEIDGAMVERASLHNLSVLRETLGTPRVGQTIEVFKANAIIPQIAWSDKDATGELIPIPMVCPICGEKLESRKDNDSIILMCVNSACEGRLINKIDHFAGKKGLDIKGLSIATLDKLIEWGWINNCLDIYSLKNYAGEWMNKPGFGEKSVQNILNAIEESKECSLSAFICALGIPLIGSNIAKDLANYFDSYDEFREAIDEKFDFSQLKGFAESKTSALLNFDYTEADELNKILTIKKTSIEIKTDKPLENKKYVITGTVKQFKNRSELQQFIEERGGKVVSGISKNVDYLINNDINSTSAKNKAAKQLGIPIISEAEFLESLN